MNKMKEITNKPELRFPEFKEDWEEKTLGNEASFFKGKGISKLDISENGNLECIRYGQLYTEYREVINNIVSRTNLDSKDLVLSRYNDVIIPASGETQLDIATASCVLKDGVALGGDLNIIRSDINGVFLSYYLNNTKKQDIASLSQGVSVVHLYSTQLKSLKINLPSKEEQTKIAEFLTSIDKKIELITKKKTQLEKYKKGVMQKIFNQEIRFKDDNGNDYHDWEELELSKFLIPTFREVNKPKDLYLSIGVRSHCKGTFQKPNTSPDSIMMDKLYEVKKNDLIVNITFAWEGAISIVKKEDDGGLVSHRFPTYVFDENITSAEFFKFVFIQKKFRLILDLISPGGAGRNRVLNKKDFLKINSFIPIIQEQTKIAEFLTSIDNKIDLVNNQLDKLKEWKKGLLQQMFI